MTKKQTEEEEVTVEEAVAEAPVEEAVAEVPVEESAQPPAEEPQLSSDPFSNFCMPDGQPLQIKIETHTGRFNPDEVKMLVYGNSGAGKTRFGATWPEVVFLDIDKGMDSVDNPGIARIPIDSWEDLQGAYEFLAYSKHPFRSVVVDSLNEIQHLSMGHVVDTYTSIRRSYDSLPGQSDYGKMLYDVDTMIRYVRALPMNVVLIAQLANREYETDPYQPYLVGKNTAKTLTQLMGVIGYIFKMESQEIRKPNAMIFDGSAYVTKDRSGRLPGQVTQPTYQILRNYWIGASQ